MKLPLKFRIIDNKKLTYIGFISDSTGKSVCKIARRDVLSQEDAWQQANTIVEACNNYETLQAENAKLQESNNAMAELLKVVLKVKQEDITIMRSQCSEDEAQTWDVLNQAEISAQRITEVLTAAGHKV